MAMLNHICLCRSKYTYYGWYFLRIFQNVNYEMDNLFFIYWDFLRCTFFIFVGYFMCNINFKFYRIGLLWYFLILPRLGVIIFGGGGGGGRKSPSSGKMINFITRGWGGGVSFLINYNLGHRRKIQMCWNKIRLYFLSKVYFGKFYILFQTWESKKLIFQKWTLPLNFPSKNLGDKFHRFTPFRCQGANTFRCQGADTFRCQGACNRFYRFTVNYIGHIVFCTQWRHRKGWRGNMLSYFAIPTGLMRSYLNFCLANVHTWEVISPGYIWLQNWNQ